MSKDTFIDMIQRDIFVSGCSVMYTNIDKQSFPVSKHVSNMN